MIDKISENIVNNFSKNKSLTTEEKEEYNYALNIFLSYALHLVTLLVIVFFTKMYWQGILYNFAYIFLRTYAGGFHAKSPKVCYFFSIFLCTAALLIIKYTDYNFNSIVAQSIVSYLIIMLLSPVEDKNKPLDEIETKVFRLRARIIATIYLVSIFIALFLNFYSFAFVISLCLTILSVMVILGLIKNRLIKALPNN